MTFVDEDVREFVAARWPDLEAVAHVVVLDAPLARRVTTDTLVDVVRHWHEALEDGRPGERARREVLRAALAAAPHATPRRQPGPGGPAVPSALPWDEAGRADDTVVAALGAALADADPLERAVVAADDVWDAGPGEVARLLERPEGPVRDAAAAVRRRLGAAHDTARVAAGLEPGRWALDHDVREAVALLLRDLDEPPDPARLVAGVAARLRRRTLVAGGAAAAGLAAGALVLGSTLRPEPPADPADLPVPPTGDPSWGSTRTWVARGGLRSDRAVAAMVAARDPGARLLWASDVADRRVVIARRDLSRQGSTTVRVWAGPRGAPVQALREVPLTVDEIEDADDAVALALPVGGDHGLLVLLSRPQVLRSAYSAIVSYTRAGGVRRAWSEVGLDDGLATVVLPNPPGPALRVRLGPYDGPPAGPQRIAIGTARQAGDDIGDSVLAKVGSFVAAASGQPESSMTSEVVLDTEVPGDVLAPWVSVARPGPGRLVVVHTRTADGSLLRSVRVRDDGRAKVGSADLETARPVAVEDARRPFATRLPPLRAEVGRFLVVAPGAARAQLLAVTATSYPVSKVGEVPGGVGILEVVNARQAAVYRLVLWDADGRRMGSWRQLLGRRDPNDLWPRFG
ncbi:hypothetical protein ACK8HX_07815 [Oryzobacter sp. R7]|uniref:hypothetical protein n=1 Tax=Oryzobacter faecalis TaxID=3388656 RepID=UPI00398C8D35